MNKIKILFITDTYAIGGAEIYLIRLVKGLDKNLYDISLLHYDNKELEYFHDQLASQKIKIIKIKKESPFKKIKEIYDTIKENDIIHLNFLNPNRCKTILFLSYLFPSKKFIGTLHLSMPIESNYPLKPQIYRVLLSILFKQLDKMICVSKQNKEFFCEHYWYDKERCHVIYNGVEIEKYKVNIDKKQKKEELGLNEKDIVFITLARICQQKGQKYLIEALPEVVKKYPKAKFLLVGNGEMKTEIEEIINKRNLNDNVKILGFRTDIAELLNISDCMILPSIREGFPFIILEAMAAGVPAIATAVNGVPEAIEDGVNGYLINPKDSNMIKEKVNHVLENKDILKSMREKCLIKIKQFSYEEMILQTQNILK